MADAIELPRQSSPRTPEIRREGLDAPGQATWDRIVGTRGTVRGPYQVLMQVPELADRVAHLGTYLRFEGLLDGAERELAILTVARELGSRYEWVGHEAIARREGTRPEAIEVARTLGPTDGLAERERLVMEVVRALYHQHSIPDDLFARAQVAFGQEQLVELVGLAGYYGMIGFTLVGFEVEPDGPPPF
jgi:4-carboxymuconolactone decarboxylase